LFNFIIVVFLFLEWFVHGGNNTSRKAETCAGTKCAEYNFNKTFFQKSKMSDNDDMFGDSRPLLRQFSTQSFTDETQQEESQNLLGDGRAGGADGRGGGADVGQVEEANTLTLLRGLKRGMDSLQTDVKRLKEQVCLLKNKFYSYLTLSFTEQGHGHQVDKCSQEK
jgi:hypothetical protein